MPLIEYVPKRFSADNQGVIDHANTILGPRVNVWTSLITLAVVGLFFARDRATARATEARTRVSRGPGGDTPGR